MTSISAAPTTSSSASSGLKAATAIPGKAPPTSKTGSSASIPESVNNNNSNCGKQDPAATTMSGSDRPQRTSSVDQDPSSSSAATSTTATGASHAAVGGPSSPPNGQSSQQPQQQQQQQQAENISYSAERIIGNGSFGVVFEAKVVETNEVVAIKKVLQDKRFKNRELQIMRQLVKDPHTNIVALKHCFYSQVRAICAKQWKYHVAWRLSKHRLLEADQEFVLLYAFVLQVWSNGSPNDEYLFRIWNVETSIRFLGLSEGCALFHFHSV